MKFLRLLFILTLAPLLASAQQTTRLGNLVVTGTTADFGTATVDLADATLTFASGQISSAAITATLTGKTYNGLTLTANATGFSIAGGTTSKTLTISNSLTLAGTDGSTLNIGTGGTLGTAAYTASTSYATAAQGTKADAAGAVTGLVASNGSATFAGRTLTAPAAGITVTNGNGVSGNPTLALANDLAAVEGLSSTGIAVRTGTDAWAQRTITGSGLATITNGNGVSGNPVVTVPKAVYDDLFAKAAGKVVDAENLDQARGVTNLRTYEVKRWWNKLYAASQGTGLATLVVYGDSVAGNQPYNHIPELWAKYGFGGAAISSVGGYDRGHQVTMAGGTTLAYGTSGAGTGDPAIFKYAATGSWYEIPSGGSLRWGDEADGYEHTGVVVHYITEPGGGTFKLQYRGIGSADWIDESGYTSVDTDATLGGAVIRISRSKAKWFHRIVSLSGTVKISTTTGVFNPSGVRVVLLSKGGILLSDTVNWDRSISDVFLSDMDPTLITLEMKGEGEFEYLPDFEDMLESAGVQDTTDVNYIGSMQVVGEVNDAAQRAQNAAAYALSRQYGRCYWSAYDLANSYAEIQQAFNTVDGTHLNPAALSYFAACWARDLRIFAMPGVFTKKATYADIFGGTGSGFVTSETFSVATAMATQIDLNDSNKVGSPYYDSFGGYYNTAATSSSETYSYTGGNMFMASYQGAPIINWNYAVGFDVRVMMDGAQTSTSVIRIVLGAQDKNIQSIASIGLEIRNKHIWLLTHNGTTLTEKDSGVVADNNRVLRLYLHSNGAGLVTLYNLGYVQLGDSPEVMAQTLGGPTAANTYAGDWGFLVYNSNGATAAVNGLVVGRRINIRAR